MRQKKLLLILFLFLSGLIHPQDNTTSTNSGFWVLDKTVKNVEFYHMISECSGKKVVFLKFNNKNNYKVKIAWKEVFQTKQQKEKIEGIKGTKELMLFPGIKSSDNCNTPNNTGLFISPEQVSLTHAVEILQFEFKEINVRSI
jgi:hypothetical protein